MNPDSPLARFRIWYAALPSAMRLLLTVNTVAYLAFLILRILPGVTEALYGYVAFAPVVPGAFLKPWTFVTHAFVHLGASFGGLLHFLFAMLWLYWMGRDYEEMYGSHRLFGLYVLAAVGGALFALAVGTFYAPSFPIYGAMGAALSVLCCVATLNPNRGIGLFLLGVVPLKYVAIGFVALSVLIGAYPAYELGAALVGYLFARAQLAGTDLAAWAVPMFQSGGRRSTGGRSGRATPADDDGGFLSKLERWASSREEKKQRDTPAASEPPQKRAYRGPSKRRARSERAKDDAPLGNPTDIDRILDKINEQGYDALTDEEKRILYEASGRA
ncbi:MAG: rhomboid family intramembrane serine protease [Bacteroidota bacterium]